MQNTIKSDILFDDVATLNLNGKSIFSRLEKLRSEGNCSSYVSVEDIESESSHNTLQDANYNN